MKKVLLLSSLIVAMFLAVGVLTTASKVQREQRDLPSKGRLQWYAKRAKDEGRQKVKIPSPITEYAGDSVNISLDEALASSTVVIAELIGKHSYQQDTNNILTWNKFRIDEVISEGRSLPCPACGDSALPTEMLPLQAREFLLSTTGGSLIVDGVQVEQTDWSFPEFQQTTKYLLFLNIYPSGIAGTIGGPVGVFRIDDKGTASPVVESSHRIRKELKERFGDSPARLKSRQ